MRLTRTGVPNDLRRHQGRAGGLMLARATVALAIALISIALYVGPSPTEGAGGERCRPHNSTCSDPTTLAGTTIAPAQGLETVPDDLPERLVFLTHRSTRTGFQLGSTTMGIIIVVVIASLGTALFGTIVFLVNKLMDEPEISPDGEPPEARTDEGDH